MSITRRMNLQPIEKENCVRPASGDRHTISFFFFIIVFIFILQSLPTGDSDESVVGMG